MDEYMGEIADLDEEITALQMAKGDETVILELERQREVLKALYLKAQELFGNGQGDLRLSEALALRGLGPWTLDNVYAYVYDEALSLADDPVVFAREILKTRFAERLLGPVG